MDRLGLGLTTTFGLATAAGALAVFSLYQAGRKAGTATKSGDIDRALKDVTVLYDPDDPEYGGKTPGPGEDRRAAVDIVAVHGLASSSDRAWTHREKGKLWLSEFLPADLQYSARIITYNHNSQWGAYSLTKPFEGYAKEFLLAIDRLRQSDEERRRSIIFIGHSFGGLLIKQALVTASEPAHEARYGNISHYTDGVIFLGVPHRGSRYTTLASCWTFLTHIFNSSNMLLKYMEYKSTAGNDLQSRYREACFGKTDQVCFYECVPMYTLGLSTGLVVDRQSATMDGWGEEVPLEADHKGMNKFSRPDDPNYLDVLQQIRIMLGKIITGQYATARLSFAEAECLRTFVHADYATYRQGVPKRHPGTLSWFMQTETFQNWELDEKKSSILWISGNPGCGKTVLAASVLDHIKENLASEESNVIYFFCDMKIETQRTAHAILRGLIYQLLSVPANHHLIMKHAMPIYNSEGLHMLSFFGSLWRLFMAIVTDLSLQRTYCVIDSLDECEESSRHDLLLYLGRLAETMNAAQNSRAPPLKILLTSRPTVEIQDTLWRYPIPRFKLEDREAEVNSDIKLYSLFKSRELAIERGYSAALEAKVASVLENGADGSFLWVSIVVEELSRTLTRNVEAKLQNLPQSMDDLYASLLSSVAAENTPFVKKILLVVATAFRPLTMEELAIACNLDPAAPEALTEDEQWRVFDAAKGLEKDIELVGPILKIGRRELVTKSTLFGRDRGWSRSAGKNGPPGRIVQLVHQTAKEFLCMTLISEISYSQLIDFGIDVQMANTMMAQICLTYLCLPEFSEGPLNARYVMEVETEVRQRYEAHPFLIYSGRYGLEHAKRSESMTAPTEIWPYFKALAASPEKLANMWQIYCFTSASEVLESTIMPGSGEYKPSGPLEIATYLGLENFVEELIREGADIDVGTGIIGNPLQAAMIARNHSMIRALVKNGAGVHAEGMPGVSTFDFACGEPTCVGEVFQVFLDMAGEKINAAPGKVSPLHYAAMTGDEWKVGLLLDRGAEINADSEKEGTPLYTALHYKNEGVARLLISRGADVNGCGPIVEGVHEVEPVLATAMINCSDTIFRELLDHGAKIYPTALSRAARFTRLAHMQILIDYGASVQAPEDDPPLEVAAVDVAVKSAILLLENKADVNFVSSSPRKTALRAAAETGSADLVSVLLKYGADVNKGVDQNNEALQAAATGGVPSVVRLLLDHGADPNAQSPEYGSAVRAAVTAGMPTTLFELLIRGALPSDSNQPPMLHSAVAGRPSRWAYTTAEDVQWHEMVIRMLLWAGVDPDATDEQGKTALDIAEEHVWRFQAGRVPEWPRREPTLEMSEAAVRILRMVTKAGAHGLLERQWNVMREKVEWFVRPSGRRRSQLDVYVDHMQRFRLVDAASGSN